jgi:hypothetical protein
MPFISCFGIRRRDQISHNFKNKNIFQVWFHTKSVISIDFNMFVSAFRNVHLSPTALGPTQPPVQWVPGLISPGVKRGQGVMLTSHPHLVPRSWMSRSYTSSPPKRLQGV